MRRIAIVGAGISGLAATRQLGADYPFDDEEARQIFSYGGSIMYGRRFRQARRPARRDAQGVQLIC